MRSKDNDVIMKFIEKMIAKIEGLKEGLDPEVLNRWYRIVEEESRNKAPDELRDKISVLQDPNLPMKFKLVISKRAIPFVIDAIESNLEKMPYATRLYFQVVEGTIWEEYEKYRERPNC